MSAILDKVDTIGIEHLLDSLVLLNKRNKKWHLAFAAIYCSRTLLSLTRNKVPTIPSHVTLTIPHENNRFRIDETTLTEPVQEKNLRELQKVPPHVALTIPVEETAFFKIDKTTLSGLVKEKNLGELQKLGGINGVASSLETSLDGGISGIDDDVLRRQKAFGFNTYNKLSFHPFVVKAFRDLTVLILLGCAALSLGFGAIKRDGLREGWLEGASILVAAFLFISTSAIINYRGTRQFEEMSPIRNNIEIDVMRGGQRRRVQIVDLVVGDIVCLKIGDKVPADGLFVPGYSLQVVESSITGGDDHDDENIRQNPFMVSGTKVANADARMLVTSVGMNTTWRQMMNKKSNDNEQTPLQMKVKKLARSMRKILEIIVVLLLVVNYFTNDAIDKNDNKEDSHKKNVYNIVASAVIIINAVVPASLPLIVNLILAKAKERMKIVASAFDTVGSVSIIVTNKTGTLTLNQMKVKESWIGHESMDRVDSAGSSLISGSIHQGVALNTTGGIYRGTSRSEFEFSSSPTEKAILSWALPVMKMVMDMELLKQNFSILFAEAFNSNKKLSGVLVKKKEDNTVHVHWKGAAELILAMCLSYYDASGTIKHLNGEERMKFKKIIQGMAKRSLQCIALAHKRVTEEAAKEDLKEKRSLEEENLILLLLALLGIEDPCQPWVRDTVEECRQNTGVNIKMITSGNVLTAKAIAIECGILRSDNELESRAVMEADQFRKYTSEQRKEIIDKICVVAGASPSDKRLLLQSLKDKGHVVAVAGINDSEVRDVVILDDNFKNLAMDLSHQNRGCDSSCKVPLKTVQLLWVNLITSPLGALALGAEEPTAGPMEKQPVGQEPLITNIMWRNLLAQAFYQIVVLLTLHYRGKSIFNVTEAVKDTLIFNTFVLCQVFNEFKARKLKRKNIFEGIEKNTRFLVIAGITIFLQVVTVEFLKWLANTERLNWEQWGACLAIAAVSWPLGCIVKCIPVPERPIFSYLCEHI
ncbi:hypothetical protein SLEP1_g51006 [Rubroshorea leprosula]|uniref:Calcium-transporting ATPase n=1 Tax=Rubroshorea leprosula TaxID=152421 RepID=A0AAV5M3A4_9ROSI|nr:hypothetical protein SLEP1_g51006 [Rubroshorea leprosula]